MCKKIRALFPKRRVLLGVPMLVTAGAVVRAPALPVRGTVLRGPHISAGGTRIYSSSRPWRAARGIDSGAASRNVRTTQDRPPDWQSWRSNHSTSSHEHWNAEQNSSFWEQRSDFLTHKSC